MSPYRAECFQCGNTLSGETVEEIGNLMIGHHGETEPGEKRCVTFSVKETNEEGQIIGENYVRTSAAMVYCPYTGEMFYKAWGKERE